ncbi:hypothetical protein G9A89_020058 [Geosiphon pyriformis]|nr:hypothetical protein G9A89_020058 [Geosiphon pyriformis]
MIKSVLDQPFKKIVLDHLVVNKMLILEPKEVKSAVDGIMKGWTKKWVASISLSVCWSNQYASLDYVSNNVFSNVMDVIGSNEFLLVVKELPNRKAAGLFGILNELWKHEDAQILSGLLDILNEAVAAGAFVNNTIWIGNCLVATQCILDIVSEFFLINNIAINTDKMVAIPINQKTKEVSLSISGFKISIAKKDVKFFSNMVLRKAITKKQFLYLVSAVLQSIIRYRLQFSCVSKGVCEKWDKIIKKSLKLKSNLLKDFPNEALYHSELYGLRTFEQVLAENLLAGLVKFVNANKIFSELFKHRHSLKFLIKLLVNPMNCFLVGTIHVFKLCNLLLGGDLPDVFQARNSIAVLDVLGFKSYLGIVKFLKRYGVKKLDSRDPVPVWFASLVKFIIDGSLSNSVLLFFYSILTGSPCNFGYVGKYLLNFGLGSIIVYTDGSIKNLGLLYVCSSAAAYFSDVDTSIGVKVDGLLSSTLIEMQAIVLVLECVFTFRLVNLYMDSQALLDLCKSASGMAGPNFCDKCWIKKEHICCIIAKKDLSVISKFFLPIVVSYCFFIVEGRLVSGNAYYVVKKLFNTVYSVGWKARCIGSVINVGFSDCFDKARIFCVWHLNGKIRFGYTSTASATLQLYFMKMLYYCLSVAERKKIYNLNYSSVVCIQCGLMEDSDHVFSCSHNVNVRDTLLSNATLEWNVLLGASANENVVAKLLNEAASSIDLFTVLAKSFVLKSWIVNTLGCLNADSDGGVLVVNFVCHFAESHRSAVWLLVAKLRAYYKKYNLLLHNRLSILLMSGLFSLWSIETIWNFGFRLSIHVCFGLHLCLTRSDFGFLCNVLVVRNLGI